MVEKIYVILQKGLISIYDIKGETVIFILIDKFDYLGKYL